MAGGRPTKYKKEYCEQLIEHMSLGLSFEAFAGVLGVSKQTLYSWAEAHPEFMDAKQIATEKCRLFWEQVGVKGLFNESHKDGDTSYSKSLNTGVWVFNMKNRFPQEWRERTETKTEHSFKTDDIEKVSVEELESRIKEALEAVKKGQS